MIGPPPFFDTNILLYSISSVAEEASKRERALTLLDGDDGALSVQVLQEFYTQATRATRPDRLSHQIAAERDTSVSALVKRFLVDLTSGETEFERLRREEQELRKRIKNFSGADRLPRDELYDRRR